MTIDADIVAAHGATLSNVAAGALLHGLEYDAPPTISAARFPDALRLPRATFVTLEHDGDLRGCIGSVIPRRPLVEDVAANAYAAGFRDPRFPPLTDAGVGRLSVGISILGPFESLACATEDDLFAQARAGIDGFVISAEGHRGLFLPQVWDCLPTPGAFFDTLREKAGLPRKYWSSQLRIERFRVTSIPKRYIADLQGGGERASGLRRPNQ
ncbi:MAG: AmmeMemoRadiSam system protein A [Rhodospirillaceae bacterium]